LRLYDDPAEREYSDCDLLVEPAKFALAEGLLRELGYRPARLEAAFPAERPQHAHTWVSPDAIAVDLHRTLIGLSLHGDDLWRNLRPDAEPLLLEGTTVLVPSAHAMALIVALHAAHHGARSEQPLRDLELALTRLDGPSWDRAAELARGLGGTAGLASGLQLLERGDRERRRLGLSRELLPDRRLAGSRPFHVAQGLTWLKAAPPGRRVSFLRERLVPSAQTMRQRSRLARHGKSGLLAAHVIRWLDALRHLPQALRALRRAR
jgi:hypothetical protein